VKKSVLAMAILIVVSIFVSTIVYAQSTERTKDIEAPYPKVKVKVENACYNEVCGEGYLINNISYVPLRVILESMGAQVEWDSKTQTVTIVRPNEEKTKENEIIDEYVTDTFRFLEKIENELMDLGRLEQQFQLMIELYVEFNDKTRNDVLSKEKIWIHQATMNEIRNQFMEYQNKYKDRSENHIRIVKITDEINNIINNYKLAAETFQNYMNTKNKEDYKRVLLYRAYALDIIEKVSAEIYLLKKSIL